MAQTINTNAVTYGDGNVNCPNINNSYNTNTTVYKSDEDAKILRWLSPLEPGNRHHDVRIQRFEGVGNWFLETSEFRQWRSGEGGNDKPVLFCFGDPGVGKTYLSSLVIDTLCDQAKEDNLTVAWLYCDYNAQQGQTVVNMVGAILKQLVGRGDIPKDIRKAFQEAKNVGGRRPLLADLMQVLRNGIASLPQVLICIDALDEYLPKNLPEVLEALRDIVRESPKTRIFLTGRAHVEEDIRRYFPKVVAMPIGPTQDDIRNYVMMRLDRDIEPEAMSDDLRAEIVKIIPEKMSNIFLLVSLNVEAIMNEVTIGRRREKLQEMAGGNGLSDAYTATLTRLKEQKGNKARLGLKALMWVLCSERPLGVEELSHALGVEIGSADLNAEKVPAIRILLGSCLGLLTVEASSSIVRLVHFTLKEHLASDPTLSHSSHSTMAEVCLTYLNFESVMALSPTLHSAPSTMPLLEYASLYWGEHARRRVTENVGTLALRLLDRFDKHISAQLLLLRYYGYGNYGPYFGGSRGPAGFTGLHGVAFFGIAEIVVPVLEMNKWDINAADGTGNTAFNWAARRGQEKVVRMLLERTDANPDQVDSKDGRTPLVWAAGGGHEGIVKMLLERKDVNPNQADTEYGRTPLWWAATGGHEGIVKILLERKDVNPDQADTEYGRTPLWWAAEGGHVGIVKILLERKDVNPAHTDTRYSQTPLWSAAKGGHEEIVKILLERKDVNPDQEGTEYGRTPLLWAAKRGHEGIVKILLERKDINPDQADTEYGWTPLLWAAQRGHEGIVKILLERKDVNPNQADTKYGRTPLWWAATGGHEEIVKIHLERTDVNPDQADTKYGRTPLLLASERGHYGIVKILLERKDVNHNQADTEYGRTPLWWAAAGGHEEIVKILLERKDVNPNQADTEYGRTPLWWAATGGHEEIVKIHLERTDINPDQADTKYGRTPLLLASERGHYGIVKILLERKDVNPNQADTKYRRTPLLWAAGTDNEKIVKMLLEHEDVKSNLESTGYVTVPSSWKVGDGCAEIAKVPEAMADCVNSQDCSSKYRKDFPSMFHRVWDDRVANRILARNGIHRAIPVGPDNCNSDNVDYDGQSFLTPAPGHRCKPVVEMQFRSQDPNTDNIYFNSQPSLPSVDSDERELAQNSKDYVSTPPAEDPATIEPLIPSQTPSTIPLEFPHPPRKSNTHHNNTHSTLPISVNRYWVIGSCVCLIAFLAYRKNSGSWTSR